MRTFLLGALFAALLFIAIPQTHAQSSGLQAADYYRLRSVSEASFSPDGKLLAYTIVRYDQPGRPFSQLWVMDLASGKSQRFGGENDPSGDAVWSRDGHWIAYRGTAEGKRGLVIAHPDGSGVAFISEMTGTNAPIPSQGADITWAPDSRQIAFVSSTPGPETTDATGDPIVITRYLYKPNLIEGNSHFNDNRRLHIFLAEIATKKVRQLTDGMTYDHSVNWSPNGDEILFISDHSPNPDQFFNYDIFALKAGDGSIRRLTATESIEYDPVWSPDGKMIAYSAAKRGLTDRETTMEDNHVWLMNSDGSDRHEFAKIDDRQGSPYWSADGRAIYFTGQERGSNFLYKQEVDGGKPEALLHERGNVGNFGVSKTGAIAYTFTSPHDLAELYLDTRSGAKQLTNLNSGVLAGKQLAESESFTFTSNDNKYVVEAFLVKPPGVTGVSKHPLIVLIHGGPHAQNGPGFNFKDQVYAARGWAVLHVNYRGSTGYGQAFTDAVFGDQDGNEAQDVLYGVSAALRRYPWLDRERMGLEGQSYGGQLTEWLITQTRMFRAAIPTAGWVNQISYNYLTYYNQYEQMEFGQLPHQGNLMDLLWERSALKHVAAVATPTMLIHGENDADVPIAESEQFFIALKDVGVETVFVRYPREDHGLRESAHIVDSINRSIGWYEKHFPKTEPELANPAVP